MNFDLLPGLKEAMKTDYVGSVYTDPKKVWKMLQNFKGGNAVFTQANTPIKCGGAPQKIMYLTEHFLRKKGIREKSNVIFATPGTVIFGVKEFADTLTEIIEKRNIYFKPFYAPIKIDGQKKEITFKYIKPDAEDLESLIDENLKESLTADKEVTIKYDMLHLAPPQQAPDFVRNSSLVYQEGPHKGWLEVDINTLQHMRYPNIFGLGDSAGLPTAKTGAAIRKQAPVVVQNLLTLIKEEKLGTKIYEGYSSCPLVTGYGSMVLAEFKYNNVKDSDPLISKFVDTSKEQYSMWLLKKYGLPFMYWNLMLRGKA
jgi:sulfide:quinone oxidoreductase